MDFKGDCKISPLLVLDGTVAAGDLVRIDADTGHLVICAAAATLAPLGWALASGVATESITVRIGTYDTLALMTLENAYAVTQLGIKYALVGATGAQMVDNNKTDADLLQIAEADPSGSTTKAYVRLATPYGEAVS